MIEAKQKESVQKYLSIHKSSLIIIKLNKIKVIRMLIYLTNLVTFCLLINLLFVVLEKFENNAYLNFKSNKVLPLTYNFNDEIDELNWKRRHKRRKQ